MIAHINGILATKGTESVVVDVNGVGYELFIPLSTFCSLPSVGESVSLVTYTHHKDDSICLYGFLTPEEKGVFTLLISVSGLGPKLARNILSGVAVADLLGFIINEDKIRLKGIPGIGAKSAERLILELKEKAAKFDMVGTGVALRSTGGVAGDVVSALDNLGYKTAQAEEAVSKAKETLGDECGFEELFKESLRAL
ncbi:MAG: Holliday junction branch migration protein RuvA [Proteobacteria bacterium]|nr:Holliday junction branch migration protein RuvA [Pseudomonadota bacterium]